MNFSRPLAIALVVIAAPLVSAQPVSRIHQIQGAAAASTAAASEAKTIEGIVTAAFQAPEKLRGFFLQEEDRDADGDAQTSEGIFVFCDACPVAVSEGSRVRVTGSVSEISGMTTMTATTADALVVVDRGNHSGDVTPARIDLPVVGDILEFYERHEGMLVTFIDPLVITDLRDQARFGQIELFEGRRPMQFAEIADPSGEGYAKHLVDLARRRVILDDDNNAQNAPLAKPQGEQAIYYPRDRGGFSAGVHGKDFIRTGDTLQSLTGVLHWSSAGANRTEAWRIRPTTSRPISFTAANPRQAKPADVGGAIRVASVNLLNFFTSIDTTADSTGTCGPAGNIECRGADSEAEHARQRQRTSVVLCSLNADAFAFMELENHPANATMSELLAAVNGRCGQKNPYAFVDTGGAIGTDAIRVAIIYRSKTLWPVGRPHVDRDAVHDRPPTAQTFEVIDRRNPARGERFTLVANHSKSKGCDPNAGPGDVDAADGQGCYAARRTAQAKRLLDWIEGTVKPAAQDDDLLVVGDFNAYAKESSTLTLERGGLTDVVTAKLGAGTYSYLFAGQLGHLDYAFASATLLSKVTGATIWHINSDESQLFDYNDEIKSDSEAPFEKKPDGSRLEPPRMLWEPESPFRASDHDPVLVGIYPKGNRFLEFLRRLFS